MNSNLLCHESSVIYPGVEFGGPAFIGPYCVIGGFGFQHPEWLAKDFVERAPSSTKIGSEARILGHSVVCSGTKTGSRLRVDYHCFVGEDCQIGDECVIEYYARIYDRVRIGTRTTISGFICNEAVIGNNCVIQGSLIHSRTKPGREPAPIIEDNCLIGAGALVIGSIVIRSGSFIAAGAVVTRDTDEGYLYIGAPARRIRKLQWF